MKSETCPSCGAKLVKYTHSIKSGSLARILIKFYKAVGIAHANPSKLGFTTNEYNNFQKLRYWGLVERTRKNGEWKITYKGIEFLNGDSKVFEKVETFRGKVSSFKGALLGIAEIEGVDYMTKEDYLNGSIGMKNELFHVEQLRIGV